MAVNTEVQPPKVGSNSALILTTIDYRIIPVHVTAIRSNRLAWLLSSRGWGRTPRGPPLGGGGGGGGVRSSQVASGAYSLANSLCSIHSKEAEVHVEQH